MTLANCGFSTGKIPVGVLHMPIWFGTSWLTMRWVGAVLLRIAGIVRRTLGTEPLDMLREVARFWLEHANLQLDHNARAATRRKAKDAARATREIATFHVLSSPGCRCSRHARLRVGAGFFPHPQQRCLGRNYMAV